MDILRNLFGFWENAGGITGMELALRIMAGLIVLILTGATGYLIIRGADGLLSILQATAQVLADLGESIKMLAGGTSAVLNGVGAFVTALGAIPTGIGNGITLVSTGIKSLLSTPETFVTQGFQTWQKQIDAGREKATISVSNGDRSFSIDISGTGANSTAPHVITNLDNLLDGPFVGQAQLPYQPHYAALPNPEDDEIIIEQPRGLLTRRGG